MIIGIDPGVSGAIATYLPNSDLWTIEDMFTLTKTVSGKSRTIYDENNLMECFRGYQMIGRDYLHAFVEDVGGLPGQSAPRAFSFGYGCGLIKMALVANEIPVDMVKPQVWKGAMRAPKDKAASIARACELIPSAVSQINKKPGDLAQRSGRAEAALIALYGARQKGLA
jgi:crossover junction endodeoxyribonuclease RuvC